MAFRIIRTEKRKREFSKKVVAAMVVLWFAAALFGGAVCWKQGYGLEGLLSFIGGPMTGGIVGYLAKSAFENREKIRQSNRENGEEHP